MFLQADIVTTPVLPADSLLKVSGNILKQASEDPSTFWRDMGEQAIHFGLKVLAALLIYMVGAWLIRKLKALLHHFFQRRKTEKTLATFVTSFVSIMLTVVLVIVTVSTLGVDTTSLAALLAAGGMAIGMALSGTVQNFAGGIMLLVFKPFKAGDLIEAQGYLGTVSEVSIVSTKLLTLDNRIVVLPNGALSNGTIDNYSAQPLRRVEWEVSVAYGTDAEACKAKLLELVSADKRVLTSADKRPKNTSVTGVQLELPIPDPYVWLKSLNANDISFGVRVWTHAEEYWPLLHDMQMTFYIELQKAGFEFAFPHCDVTILNPNTK